MCLLLLNNNIWCTYAITVPIGLFTLYFHLFILSPSLAGNSSHDSSGKTLAWKEGLILFFISSSLIYFLFADFFFHFLRHQFNKVSAEVSSAANRCRKFLLHKVAIAYIATSLDLSLIRMRELDRSHIVEQLLGQDWVNDRSQHISEFDIWILSRILHNNILYLQGVSGPNLEINKSH